MFTIEQLIGTIWPDIVLFIDRSIDVHITRIRNKISPYGKNIISRSGYGYGWQD
ncbi:MAG: helix-turn-helix domain-containing protein [Muribaculaceae bacterium]|nr:helix-turn-helix domain-containing protein [Muribaculaceae bacterium]